MAQNDILFVAVNSKYIHSSLSLLSLASSASFYSKKYNIVIPEIHSKELTINEPFDSIMYNITADGEKIFCFSVYIWNIDIITKICKQLKKAYGNCTIILGGPEVSYGIKHTNLDSNDYDYIISGEGERTLFYLICSISNINFEPKKSWGISIAGKTISSNIIEDFANLPLPYTDENIDSFGNKIIYYESSRGCPFNCAYCLSSVCGKVRCKSSKQVFDDIDFFLKHNIPQVKFVDRTFNFDKKRAYDIWEYIIENANEKSTNFHFEIGGDLLNENQLELLKKAKSGLIQFEIGIQSTKEKTLTESCRNVPKNLLFNNIKALTAGTHINIHLDLIAGLPYESFEEFKASFNDVYALKPHQLQLGFLKILSGAPMNNLTAKHGYVFSSYPPYEIIKNNCITYDEILKLKQIEDIVERFYNSQRFTLSLEAVENQFDSAFDFYEKLSCFFEEKGLTFTSISTRKLYDFLKEFFQKNNINFREETLLLDYYLSEKSEQLPSSLRHLNINSQKKHNAVNEITKKYSPKNNKLIFGKFINNTLYLIDYSQKDWVTGRYKILQKFFEVLSDE